MDLIYFFKVLYRKKWIILALAFLAGVTTFLLLLTRQPLYVSSAQYSTGFTTEKVRLVDGSSAVDLFSADVKFNNAIETFKSPKVINNIGYKLMLHDLENPDKAYKPLSKSQMGSKLYKAVDKENAKIILRKKILNNSLLETNKPEEALLIDYLKMPGYDYEGIMDYLIIEREGRTDYLNTTFRSVNPELSALVVNGLGTEFLNYYKNLTAQRTQENAEGIKKMLSQQQSKVDSIGKLLYQEKVKQGSIDPISLSTSAMETVKELESRLAEEKSKQNEHLNRKQYLEKRLNQLQAQAGSSGSGSGNKEEIIRLTNRKNKLVADLAEKGGNDAAIQSQIDDLRDQINSKISRGSGGRSKTLDKDISDLQFQISEENAMYNAANATIADYSSRIRKYTGMANNASLGSDVTIDVIKTQLDMENVQLGNYMEKYSQAEGLVKDDPTANFIQTKVGQQAIDPESKKTLITMILASMAMFFLSSVIFLFIEIFDPTLKTPTIFKKQMKMNLVSILNHVPLKKKEISDILQAQEMSGRKQKVLAIFKNNVRQLRYSLLNSDMKIFLFTSTQQGSGKTTVVEALAQGLLLSKKKVLIMDLNFKNNSLTKKYGADIFIEDIDKSLNINIPIAGQKIGMATNFEGLHIIGCKEANLTPAEALHDINLAEILNYLKSGFDYILIEAASLNHFSDAKELSNYVEAIYIVFSADDSVDHADDESLKFIAGLGSKNKGAILNNVLTENLEF